MSGVAADVGLVADFNARFNNTWPTSKDFTAKLFCNFIIPADTDTAGMYTEAVGGGYASKTLACGSWTISTVAGIVQAVYAQQVWTFTGPLTTNLIVFGFYIIDGDGVLKWAESLPTPVQPAVNGNFIKITPIYRASKGTPT